MKSKILGLTAVILMAGSIAFAGSKTEKIKVNGNCGMCETRIEKAAKSLEGVSSADWDSETKIMEVSYDDVRASTQQIQTAIAMAGHDTQLFSANDKKYAELPGCCQYQRDENRKANNHGMGTECVHTTEKASESCCGKTSCDK
jgi:copper chaperone CopZ